MAITFQVSRVERATAPLRMPAAGAPLRLQKGPVEAMGVSLGAPFLPSEQHGLLRAAHLAYALHYPLVVSPDTIWLAIAQGFAMHVNANAERLRSKLVRHQGQVTLEVQRDDFVKGSPDNAWPEVFSAFSDTIAGHLGRQRDLVVCDFSTTGPCERAASEIVLLDAVQRYFRYEVHTLCGIPEVTLEGTVDDWRAIRRRARALEEYELGFWTDALGPVLDALVATAEGRVDPRFWQTFFKHADGSGGPWVRGWINVLFPYLRRPEDDALVQNDRMASWQSGLDGHFGGGPSPASIPSGLSCVPFVWRYLMDTLPMQFLGGFLGVTQDAVTLAVRPAVGWAVRDEVPVPVRSRAELEREAFAAFQGGSLLPREVTLLAGRVSGALTLTAGEIATLLAKAAPIAAASGFKLATLAAGDFASAAEFPEAPLPCRILVGVPLGSVTMQSSRYFDGTALRAALVAAGNLPGELSRALADLVPGGLDGEPELYLAASGPSLAGELDTITGRVAAVTSGSSPVALVQLSPGKPEAMRYELRAKYHAGD